MKRLSILMMILFVSACSNGETTENEVEVQRENVEKTAKSEDNKLNELEKENEELRQHIAKKENEKLKAELEEQEAEKTESNISSSEKVTEEAEDEAAVQEFTQEEQLAMNQMFYDWAVERAKIGNMAVSKLYFSHGAAGRGDWYAVTPDGEVQVQDQDNPGFNHFDIHAVGGVVFYQPASGDFGEGANTPLPGTAEGYSRLALPDTDIHKYMLGDNGVVYELIGKKEFMGLSSGFGEYDDEGTYGEYPPGREFEISGDQEAQEEWQRILAMYQR